MNLLPDVSTMPVSFDSPTTARLLTVSKAKASKVVSSKNPPNCCGKLGKHHISGGMKEYEIARVRMTKREFIIRIFFINYNS
jgi:hypothetical protein